MSSSYDLWVDFASMDDDGTLWTSFANVQSGRKFFPHDIVVVGSEDARPARAEVLVVDTDGITLKLLVDGEAAKTA